MKYGFGTWIKSNGQIGIIVEVRPYSNEYYVKFQNGNGRLLHEKEVELYNGVKQNI